VANDSTPATSNSPTMIRVTTVPVLSPSSPPSGAIVEVVVGICAGPTGSSNRAVVVVRGIVTAGVAVVVVDASVVVVSKSDVDVPSGKLVVVEGKIVTVDWLVVDVVLVVVVVVPPSCAEAGRMATPDTTNAAPATTIN